MSHLKWKQHVFAEGGVCTLNFRSIYVLIFMLDHVETGFNVYHHVYEHWKFLVLPYDNTNSPLKMDRVFFLFKKNGLKMDGHSHVHVWCPRLMSTFDVHVFSILGTLITHKKWTCPVVAQLVPVVFACTWVPLQGLSQIQSRV